MFVFVISSHCEAQTIYQNSFDHYTTERTYNDDDLDNDWNNPSFNNGVTEGRVTIVTGAEAYGGSGSAIAVEYPANEHGPRETGAQWKFDLDQEYEELYLQYRIRFENGFDFVRGGKLPGLAGGTSPTGNTQADGTNGWTGRLMWRTEFNGVSGQPEQLTSTGISYAKYTDSGFAQDGRNEDREYWFDSNGDAITIASGTWYQIKQRIKMNTPGVSNGILQIWLDDELVLDQQDVLFRTVADLKIDQMYFSTFFGGNDDWATSKDETVYFDEFEIYAPEPRFLKVPENYSTIQEAIDAANPGDTVAIRGVQYENVVVDKDVLFRGYTGTILIAQDHSIPTVRVTSGNVYLKRIDVRYGSDGILVESGNPNVTIDDMIVRWTSDTGIKVESGCHGARLEDNFVWRGSGTGVSISESDNVELIDTRSFFNGGVGVLVDGGDGLTIENNDSVGNSTGFILSGSRHNITDNYSGSNDEAGYLISGIDHVLFDNLARFNATMGFGFLAASDNMLLKNYALQNSGNGFDFRLESNDNMVEESGARNSGGAGFEIAQSSNNVFLKNWSYFNQDGFVLNSDASGNSITQSRATDNTGFGILDNGSSNTFSQNVLLRNGDQ